MNFYLALFGFLLEDIQEGTFDYSDYVDQPYNESPERFDNLFDTELENDFDDDFKEKLSVSSSQSLIIDALKIL